jgi:SHS family lactate transporter-like MFS transporter
MPGIWGLSAATGLENVPMAARGLCSGILQQGYSVGYLLAAVINIGVVPHSKYTWRSLYFIGAGFSLAAAIFRACLPESPQFVLAKQEARASGRTGGQTSRAFLREIRDMFRTNCKLFSCDRLEWAQTDKQGFDGSGLFAWWVAQLGANGP